VTAAVPICNGSGAPKRYHQSRSRLLLVWACAFGGAFPAFMGCGRLSWSGVGRGSCANQPASGFLRARKHDDLNNAFLKARGDPHRSHESRSSATCRSISLIVRPEGGKVLRSPKSASRSLARGDTNASSVDGAGASLRTITSADPMGKSGGKVRLSWWSAVTTQRWRSACVVALLISSGEPQSCAARLGRHSTSGLRCF